MLCTIFKTQTNRDNATISCNTNDFIIDTTKCTEIMHHNFISSNTINIQESSRIKISVNIKIQKIIGAKGQFTILFNFKNRLNKEKRVEKKNIIFTKIEKSFFEIFLESQDYENELEISIYINKSMKFKVSIEKFNVEYKKNILQTEKVRSQNNPIEYINLLIDNWQDDEAIDFIKKAWQERKETIIKIFLNYNKIQKSSKVKLWLSVFIIMRNGMVPNKKYIKFIVSNLCLFNSSKHIKDLENNIMNLLIKIKDLNFLEESFNKFRVLTYENLHIFYKIGILRVALDTSQNDYKRFRKIFNNFSKIELLKIYELDVKANLLNVIKHDELLNRLKNSIQNNISIEEFNKQIYYPMQKVLYNNSSYLDCRVSNDELNHIYNLIKKSIISKKPFSLVRLGDAEVYILNTTNNQLSNKESENFEYALWGRKLTKEKRKEIASSCLEAFTKADVVGVFSVYRFIRDIHSNTKTLDGLWKLTRLLDFISKNTKNKIAVEERIHHLLFNFNTIKEFIDLSDKVIFITSIEPFKIIKTFNNKNIKVIQTPTEAHMFTNKNFTHKKNEILPDVTQNICKKLSKDVTPGTLVLVASGLAGKQFIDIAKQCGGIGLDIGCMADYYIGSKTRSIVELI